MNPSSSTGAARGRTSNATNLQAIRENPNPNQPQSPTGARPSIAAAPVRTPSRDNHQARRRPSLSAAPRESVSTAVRPPGGAAGRQQLRRSVTVRPAPEHNRASGRDPRDDGSPKDSASQQAPNRTQSVAGELPRRTGAAEAPQRASASNQQPEEARQRAPSVAVQQPRARPQPPAPGAPQRQTSPDSSPPSKQEPHAPVPSPQDSAAPPSPSLAPPPVQRQPSATAPPGVRHREANANRQPQLQKERHPTMIQGVEELPTEAPDKPKALDAGTAGKGGGQRTPPRRNSRADSTPAPPPTPAHDHSAHEHHHHSQSPGTGAGAGAGAAAAAAATAEAAAATTEDHHHQHNQPTHDHLGYSNPNEPHDNHHHHHHHQQQPQHHHHHHHNTMYSEESESEGKDKGVRNRPQCHHDDETASHTSAGSTSEGAPGVCSAARHSGRTVTRLIIVGWDRTRTKIMIALLVIFAIWVCIFFPLLGHM